MIALVGACIDVMATDLPRCSTMPNTTPMNVILYDGQYQVWFSTTSSSEGKQSEIIIDDYKSYSFKH